MKTNAFDLNSQRRPQLFSLLIRPRRVATIQSLTWEQQLRAAVKEKAQQGEYTAAIALLNQLIARHPDCAIDYNNRGLMHFYNGQHLKALQDYTQALAFNDKIDSVYNNRANCHAAVGNLAAALEDYEKALDLNPGNLRALINQGVTFRQLGLSDLAIENFDLALIIGCSLEGRIYAERGYTYQLQGDWNCAIADYYRALEHLPLTNHRYRQQVENWIEQLLAPLSA